MAEQPRFVLLHTVPVSVIETPPLAGALQSFENSIFLIGLGRFPAALTACGMAVESTIRAIRGYEAVGHNDGLRAAIDFVIKRKPKFRLNSLAEFTAARNDFTHYGYSPNDDERAVRLLFEVGYPFLSRCLWEFHNFSIRVALFNDLWKLIEIGEKVVKEVSAAGTKLAQVRNSQQVSAAKALQHAVWISFNNPLHARWTDIERFDLPDREYNAREKFKDALEQKWGFHTYVDCPLPTCSSLECFVSLDEEALNKLRAVALLCVDCNFRLGIDDAILMQYLIGAALEKVRTKVLTEYGLET